MPTGSSRLLIIWNVLLSLVLGWSVLHIFSDRTAQPVPAVTDTPTSPEAAIPVAVKDTAALKDAHIAFFFMDTIQERYDLVKESAGRVRSEGQRLEGNLQKELQKAQARAQELAAKDGTYSTKAELEADQQEFEGLQQRIGELRASSQEQLEEMQVKALQRITGEIQSFLAEYNKTAGFDFIFSIQDEGQIWVGNKGLDITADVVAGLNARHRAQQKK